MLNRFRDISLWYLSSYKLHTFPNKGMCKDRSVDPKNLYLSHYSLQSSCI